MDLSGIAAILALVGIPVGVLTTRWQMRATLRQAEMAQRSALDVAARQSDGAKELATEQQTADRNKWMLTTRYTVYRSLQGSVANFKHEVLASDNEWDRAAVEKAFDELHEGVHSVSELGPEQVGQAARMLKAACFTMMRRASGPGGLDEIWRRTVSPARQDLDEAIRKALAD
ncbi:hypothetical protein [Streptomyces sp. NPDC048665]|uniref:hypothetical protein n=1 Tax=Streptomyces sp. NPDC048665 TaxID=3155490 RepID=UPI0034306916